jgi:acetylornithine/N-succinyldiaminopimelate aminotransferase
MNQRELFLRHVAQTSELPLSGIDINVERAEGSTLYDANGKVYTDLISGISVSSLGHCHPRVVKAIRDQSEKFMHLMVYGEFNQSPQVKYATLLTGLLPYPLDCLYYTTGGSEAVEAALKLAKRVTGRTELISFTNAYHGSTHGALSVMGDEFFRSSFRPLLPDTRRITFNSISELQLITKNTAAVLVELVQGEAGVVKANQPFIKELRAQCDKTGTLLIVDEIQTGFGRTGTLFAIDQYGVVPDMLLLAKGMGGGLPIGGLVASKELLSHFTHNPVLGHINTFGGNAVCVAAAAATLEVLTEQKLSDRARVIGDTVGQRLQHRHIREVRTAGALCAVEFHNESMNMKVIRLCLERGIITDWFLFCTTAMRIAPPLVISDEQLNASLDTILQILDGL